MSERRRLKRNRPVGIGRGDIWVFTKAHLEGGMDFCWLGAGKGREEENGSILLTCFLPCGFFSYPPTRKLRMCSVCA